MLDQVVIGVARKGQGIEPERIHRRQPQQSETGIGGLQMGQVEIDDIVAQQKFYVARESVQLLQSGGQTRARRRKDKGLACVRTHSCERVDAAVPSTDLKVE